MGEYGGVIWKSNMQETNFGDQLAEKAGSVNCVLERLLARWGGNEELEAALRYTLKPPGKRVRSAVVLWS